MKIGIFVHSKTGNTLSVARRLQEKFNTAGHEASLHKITAINDDEKDFEKITLLNMPDVKEYDILIFGAPVRGFSLSPAMQAFLTGIELLQGRKTAVYMTQAFPYPWMGGTRALKQGCKICTDKGADIFETGIINWSNSAKREALINALLEKLCNLT